MSRHPSLRWLVVISLVMTMIWMFGLGSSLPWVHVQSPASTGGAVDLTMAVMQVAQHTIPAVVHIEVTERQEAWMPARQSAIADAALGAD